MTERKDSFNTIHIRNCTPYAHNHMYSQNVVSSPQQLRIHPANLSAVSTEALASLIIPSMIGVGMYTAGKLHLLSATHARTRTHTHTHRGLVQCLSHSMYQRSLFWASDHTDWTVNNFTTTFPFVYSIPFISLLAPSLILALHRIIDSLRNGLLCVKCGGRWGCMHLLWRNGLHGNLSEISKEIIAPCDLQYR